jgi:hypothetical protein
MSLLSAAAITMSLQSQLAKFTYRGTPGFFANSQVLRVAFSLLADAAGRSVGTSMLTFPVSRQSGFSIRDKT